MVTGIGELFDRDADFDQWDRCRPHRTQPAAIAFLTMRLNDSIPTEVIQRWHRERVDFLFRHGVQCGGDWKSGREELSVDARQKFDKQFQRARETTLDQCLGGCELAKPMVAKKVAASLLNFHRDRYWMGDFVIMPNHVHCLVAFISSEIAKKQPGEWMRYTAVRINRMFTRKGALWFPEPFDHLVRSEEQLRYLRDYIRLNPSKANLSRWSILLPSIIRAFLTASKDSTQVIAG